LNTSGLVDFDLNLNTQSKKELKITVINFKNNHSDNIPNILFTNKSNYENYKLINDNDNKISNNYHFINKKALPGVFLQATNTTSNKNVNNDTGLSTCLQELLNFYGCGEKVFQDILIIVGGLVLIVNCK